MTMTMEPRTLAIAAIALTVVFAMVVVALIRQRAAKAIPVVARPILTKAEIVFHQNLVAAVNSIGGMAVQTQTAMSAFIQPRPGLPQSEHLAVFRRFSQKRPDFVLVDASWNVLLIVELDDRTHDAVKDAERDRLTMAAGIPTVRFTNGRGVTAAQIASRISDTLHRR